MSVPVTFSDGAGSPYGFGLGRRREFGRDILGHGGALRGWRSHRLYSAQDRVSVVIMFNHLSDAQAAALDVLAAVLGVTRTQPDPTLPVPSWIGSYLEPETGLAVRIDPEAPGRLRLRFGHSAEKLDLQPDGTAGHGTPAAADGTRLRWADGALWMDRPQENQSSRLRLHNGSSVTDIAGRYRCAEMEAELTVADTGGLLYGAFSGALGGGRMELLDPIGQDLWALPCWRALDHTPPGDWTLRVHRDSAGAPAGITVGCWLARGLDYVRVD